MRLWRSIHELGRSRRAVMLTPLIIALVAVLLWTLEHTDIVAFAIISIAALVLVSGTFWATGPSTNREIKVTNAQSVLLSLGERVMGFNSLESHPQIARGGCFKRGCAGRILPSGRIEGGPLLHYRSDTHRCRMSAPMGTTQSRRVDPRPAALLFRPRADTTSL